MFTVIVLPNTCFFLTFDISSGKAVGVIYDASSFRARTMLDDD